MRTKQLLIRYENALNYFIKAMVRQSMWFSIEPGPDDWWFIGYKADQGAIEFMNRLVDDNRHFIIHKEEEVERLIGCGCTK